MEIYFQIIITPNRGKQQAVKVKVTLKLYHKTYKQKTDSRKGNKQI